MKDKLINTIAIATAGGFFYLAVRYVLHLSGADLSTISDWLFRLTLIVFVLWSIFGVKVRQNGWITFKEAFGTGMLTTFFLTIYLSFGSWLFCTAIAPNYNIEAEKIYRAKRFEQMLGDYMHDNEIEKPTEEDYSLINNGLDKHMENTKFFFTAGGQAAVSGFYAPLWGLAISFTVSFMSRKVKED
jgi:hypothetical protein